MPDWLPLLGGIIFVDLILSGDNALIIGAVASRFSDPLRWLAFVIGGAGAILLRISLTYPISLLIRLPLLQASGGCLLLFVTARLFHLKPEETMQTPVRTRRWPRLRISQTQSNFALAMLAIIVADAMTSLDNIIAIAALAKDNQVLLIVGLFVSITFLLLASVLISSLIKRLPMLLLVAAIILTITSVQLILQDPTIANLLAGTHSPWWHFLVYIVAFICILPFGYAWVREQFTHQTSNQLSSGMIVERDATKK